MTQFRSIKEALQYRELCPICNSKMLIDNTHISMKYDISDYSQKMIWEDSTEKVIINLQNDTIEEISTKIDYSSLFTLNGTINQYLGRGNSAIMDGELYLALNLNCGDCGRYDYIVQICIDVKVGKVSKLILNSETISIEDGSFTHEIINSYVMNRTKYSYFKSMIGYFKGETQKDGSVLLPLVNLDFSSPEKTLARVKKLVIFS